MTSKLDSATTVDEIADHIYRISTSVGPEVVPGGFTFNRYLIDDDAPLLFHTGPRKMADSTRAAIERVMPIKRLRYIAFSHFESDECGALNELLALAPGAVPLCGSIGAMVSVNDIADRPARPMNDGETLSLGRASVTWIDAPHMPHGWDCGYLMETNSETLLCGDLFTQPGASLPALTESDILEPSEAMRGAMDYFSHTRHCARLIERLAAFRPSTLACMHGSAWRGDGSKLLRALAGRLDQGD